MVREILLRTGKEERAVGLEGARNDGTVENGLGRRRV